MKSRKTISVSAETHKALYEIGQYGESTDELIRRIIAGFMENELRKQEQNQQQQQRQPDVKAFEGLEVEIPA